MIEARLTRVASGYTGIYPAAKGSSAEEPEGLCLNPKVSGAAENIRCTVVPVHAVPQGSGMSSFQASGKAPEQDGELSDVIENPFSGSGSIRINPESLFIGIAPHREPLFSGKLGLTVEPWRVMTPFS